MATSTVPAFKSALVARLQADSDMAGVVITYGPPQPGEFGEPELVWVGAARGAQRTAAMGQKRREETWDQDIIVTCKTALRNDQETLTERAYEIAGVIEDSLRAWSQVGGAYFGDIVRHGLVVGMDLDEFVSTEEREARITMRVACAQRI
jgi:hypothetical protein